MRFDELSKRVIGCAIEVNRNLGPGLLESTFEQCLAHELKCAGIPFMVQHPLPVNYSGVKLDCGYRVDLFIDTKIIVELKKEVEMTTVQPEGEDLRKAVKWISDERKFNPEAQTSKLIEAACLKFDLSPMDAEYLLKMLKQKQD